MLVCQICSFELCIKSLLDVVCYFMAFVSRSKYCQYIVMVVASIMLTVDWQITLLGLLIVVTNFATMLYYDPHYLTEKDGATGPPQWIYFTWGWLSLSDIMDVWLIVESMRSWAIGLFAYQSFDAIDGKQARRTGMAGPLGEMFDHGVFCGYIYFDISQFYCSGCDALNTTVRNNRLFLSSNYIKKFILAWSGFGCTSSQSGSFVVDGCFSNRNAGQFLFNYMGGISHRCGSNSYHLSLVITYACIGQLYLGVFSGPVEGIIIVVVIYAITGFFGKVFGGSALLASHLPLHTLILQVLPSGTRVFLLSRN